MKLDYFTNTYKQWNEDTYGMTKHAAFVIDGASALLKNNFTSLENDVVWFVQWWKNYLENSLENFDLKLSQIVEQGIHLCNDEFNNFTLIDQLSTLEKVSASIGIIRIGEEKLETFLLGDCEIRLLTYEDKVIKLVDDKIEKLDNEVKKLMASNKNRLNELVFKDFTQEELDLLRVNRQKMNSEGGYFILSHDTEAVNHAIAKEYHLKDIKNIIIQSDGLVMLDNFYSAEQLFTKMSNGVEGCIKELREIEQKDELMSQFVRLKKHDDATAIFIDEKHKC